MAEGTEFKPKKEFGSIPLADNSELKFYVDEYRGYSYASIRTFLKRPTYSGPTKAGVTMNLAALEKVIATLSQLPKEPEALEEKELARLPKRAGLELVLRVTLYKDSTGIDIREWIDDGTYKGWSKKGARIPYGNLSKAQEYLREMLDFLKKG